MRTNLKNEEGYNPKEDFEHETKRNTPKTGTKIKMRATS
jgi:hypothetical protein